MKPNFTLSKKLFTIILLSFFASITNTYAQDAFDGDYCPAPGAPGDEYATGIVFSKLLLASPSSTCQIGTIRAKVNTITQTLRLGMNIGNGGAALFRIYLDIDNSATSGLTSDSFGGPLLVDGAEFIIEINSNASTFNLYSGNGSTLTPLLINNGLAAKNGSATGCSAGGGEFLEFNIPFGSIGINICDPLNPGFIKITKLASVSGNSASSSRCINTPLSFGIPLKGAVGPNATVCADINSTALNATGITGSSTIIRWESSIYPFTTWVPITNTTLNYTAINLTETKKFRAVFSNSGLCSGNEIVTSEATITVNPNPIAAAGPDQTKCNTSSFTMAAVPTVGTGAWTFVGASGTAVITSPTSATTTVTSVPTNMDITLRWTETNGNCSSTDDVVIRNNAQSIAAAGPDQTKCNTNSFTMAAVPTVGTGAWTFVGASGTAVITSPTSATTTVTSVPTNMDITLRWTETNGNCSSTDDVVIRNNAQSIAAAGPDQTKCNTSSFTMAAVPTVGTGAWTFVGASGTAVITSPTSATTTVTSVPTNMDITLRWTETNGNCSSTDDVVIRNNAQSIAAAGPDQTKCNTSSFTMTAVPTVGTGAWTFVGASGTAVITSPTSATTTVTSVPTNMDITLRWTETNGNCSSTDDVVIRNNAQSIAAAGPDQTKCNTSSFTMAAVPTVGTGAWTFVGASGTAVITSPTSATTTVTSVPTNMDITLRWTETNGNCSSTDDVVIRNNAQSIAAAGPDQTKCNTNSFTMAAVPTVGTGAWTFVGASGTAVITSPTSATTTVTSVPTNMDITLRWTETNGNCSSTDDVVIRNNAQSIAAAGPDQTKCNTSSFTMTAVPTVGTGAWTFVGASGTAVITSPTSATTTVTSVPTNMDITLRWTETNGNCSSTDDVVIRNNAQSIAAAGPDQTKCNTSSFTMTAVPTVGTGAWTFVGASGTAVITSPTSATTTVTSVPTNMDITLRWTETNGNCSSTDDVVIRNNAQSVAAAGPDQTKCNTSSFTMAAVPTVGTGAWTFVGASGTAVITSPTSATTTVTSVPTNMDITLRWTETNGNCSSTDDVVIRNNAQSIAAAGPDQTKCNTSSFTMTAVPTVGTGAWTFVGASGTAVITSPTSATTTVTSVPTNMDITLRWTETNGNCSSTDDVVIRNNAQSIAAAGPDQTKCNTNSFTMAAVPTVGTGAWTFVGASGTAVITSPTSATTTVTSVPTNMDITLRWTETNGNCSSTDDVVIRNNAQSIAAAGPDQTKCNTSSFTMAAVPTVGTGAWTFVGASGTAVITSPTSATTTVTSVPTNMDITLRWTETNGNCSSTDDVVIRNNAQSVAAAGPDQTKCNTSSFTMAAVPTVGTGAWTFVGASGTAVITSPTSATTTVTSVPTNMDITLRWTETNGNCSSTDDVVIRNNAAPAPPISGGNIIECKDPSIQTITASATVPAGQSIVWYTDSTAGQVILNPTLNTVHTITYYAQAVNNTTSCVSLTRTAVTLTINSCSIKITKDGTYQDTNNDGITNVGDKVIYNFVVTNTSNVTLTGILVSDINAIVSGGPIDLSAGASDSNSFTAYHIITQQDIDTGFVYNWATATGNPPTGDPVRDTSTDPTPCTSCPIDPQCPDCTITPLTQSPNISIVKTNNISIGENGCASLKVGDVVTYTFTVTNPGNVSLHNVSVTDAHVGLSAIALQSGDLNTNSILEVSETWVYQATYIVNQSDIDTGSITNQASASGTAPDESIVTDLSGNSSTNNEPNVIPICSTPNIAIVKTNDISIGENGCASLKVGDVVTYTFSVTNPGNVSLHNVVLTDPHAGLSTIAYLSGDLNANSILEVSETWVYQATYIVNQSDIDTGSITNQASASGTAPDESIVTDLSGNSSTNNEPNVIPICSTPNIAIVKTNNISIGENGCASLKVGDVVTYTFTVTNPGNVSLHDISVTDAHVGLSAIALQSGDLNTNSILEVSETWVYQATYIVNQSDIDTGSITNQASASGTAPNQSLVTDLSGDSTTNNEPNVIPICSTPNIAIVKTNDISIGENGCASLKVGDVVTYTFSVTNPGNVSLHNVVLTDPHAGLSTIAYLSGDLNANSILEVSETWIYTATYTVNQSDIDTGSITNQASVNGTAPNEAVVTDLSGNSSTNNEPNVIPICTSAAIAIVKTNDIIVGENGCANLKVGDIVKYTFTVTNPGNLSLHNVSVTDAHVGLSAIALQSGDANTNNILEVSEAWIYTATYTVTQADLDTGSITNQASVNGTAPDASVVTDLSGNSATDNNPNIIPICTSAGIAIVKVSDSVIGQNGCASLKVGDLVTYTFTVTNQGNLSLHNITVIDNLKGLSSITLQNGDTNNNNILEVTETWIYKATYTVTQNDVNTGSITNQASVNGTAPDNVKIKTDLSGATITDNNPNVIPICASPSIALVKTAVVGGNGAVGDTITYTFAVTNTGNVTITNIIITDPMVGLTITNSPIASLAPGATNTSVKGTYIITQADINLGSVTNSALAVGQDPKGNDVRDVSGTTVENDNPTVIQLNQTPGLTVTKISNTAVYSSVGDVINYTIQIKNTGNVTLHQITVTDPLTGLDTIIDLLAPGESKEFTQNYTVTQKDRENQSVTNVAYANGFTPNDSPINASDTVVVEAAIVLGCGSINVHNAFSPNGDGINELFIIDNINDVLCYPDNTVEIYNRWGILVFETKNYDNVNKVFKGFSEGRTTINQSSGLPAGTYFYILTYSFIDGSGGVQINKKDGYLYLTR